MFRVMAEDLKILCSKIVDNLYFRRNYMAGMYNEASSCNHCYSRKTIHITYLYVFVVLGTQREIHMRHTVICGLSGPITFFHMI
jgi:hypothetical protein